MAFGLKRLKNWGKIFKTTWSFTVINAGNDDDTCAAETQKHRNHRKNTYTHRLHLKCFWFLFSLSLSLVHLFNFNLCNMIALNGAFRWILFHFIWLWASFDGPHNSWLAKKRRHIQPVRCQVCEFPQFFLFGLTLLWLTHDVLQIIYLRVEKQQQNHHIMSKLLKLVSSSRITLDDDHEHRLKEIPQFGYFIWT